MRSGARRSGAKHDLCRKVKWGSWLMFERDTAVRARET